MNRLPGDLRPTVFVDDMFDKMMDDMRRISEMEKVRMKNEINRVLSPTHPHEFGPGKDLTYKDPYGKTLGQLHGLSLEEAKVLELKNQRPLPDLKPVVIDLEKPLLKDPMDPLGLNKRRW